MFSNQLKKRNMESLLPGLFWNGSDSEVAFQTSDLKTKLLNLDQPCFILEKNDQLAISNSGETVAQKSVSKDSAKLLAFLPPMPVQNLGDEDFLRFHRVSYAYFAGSMANGISSEELVIALGKKGILSSFGAGGLIPSRVESAIKKIQSALPKGPYAFNLIHSPSEEALEKNAVDLFIKYQVQTIEASAFLDLTTHVVRYRVLGLAKDSKGNIIINNKVMAKISRKEVATKFMEPPPLKFLNQMLEKDEISKEQHEIAQKVPMADDITVEADSGGHTDNRPLVVLLPTIIELRDQIQRKYAYSQKIRVGAGGGIGTPEAALGAFAMGAAYVVTGSVNQACVEAGTSEHVKHGLSLVGIADVMMAPASDMFEMGVKLQVLKRGTLFPMRAQKLYEIYQQYGSIDEIPADERDKIQKMIFQKNLEEIWRETIEFFSQRDPELIRKAEAQPKKKMALIFRWYLGLSSHWANSNEPGREMDYQIWCGPSMGAFNDWSRDTYLSNPENREVFDVANQIMIGAAYLYRIFNLNVLGIQLPEGLNHYKPVKFK
ncbi:MAG: PfaD family polyunsaturated fatty acid/polyketide biosynthesis protein [Deltaproteobacteria bacterium]|nr:PfaD family polyunsaturated fatty acid/polyketide biosynthesis protein [Deltaproteobacteria bacterium]